MIFQTLDDPPLPDQLQLWAKVRAAGRQRYIWRGILVATLFALVIWLIGKVIVYCIFGMEFDFTTGIPLLPVGPVAGWLILREQWMKNENIYAKSAGLPEKEKETK